MNTTTRIPTRTQWYFEDFNIYIGQLDHECGTANTAGILHFFFNMDIYFLAKDNSEKIVWHAQMSRLYIKHIIINNRTTIIHDCDILVSVQV